MKPINAENPRELEKFADLVERTVVTLKENKQNSDLEGGTLYAIVLETFLSRCVGLPLHAIGRAFS